MNIGKVVTPLLMLFLCHRMMAQPIHIGKFYTTRTPLVKDTIYLPVDQEYIIRFSVYRYIDSIRAIDNQEYRLFVNDLNLDPTYSKLQDNPDDLLLYKYLVMNHKALIPMFIRIYVQTDSMLELYQEKPIDVLFYQPTILSGNCYESYQSSRKTCIGLKILNYMRLFNFYLQQKITKELTIVSKESGDLLIDDIYVILLPNKDIRFEDERNNVIFYVN